MGWVFFFSGNSISVRRATNNGRQTTINAIDHQEKRFAGQRTRGISPGFTDLHASGTSFPSMPFPVTASGIVARPREIFFVTIFPNTLILELLFTVYIYRHYSMKLILTIYYINYDTFMIYFL